MEKETEKKKIELTDEELEQTTVGGMKHFDEYHPCNSLKRCAGSPAKMAQCTYPYCPFGYI